MTLRAASGQAQILHQQANARPFFSSPFNVPSLLNDSPRWSLVTLRTTTPPLETARPSTLPSPLLPLSTLRSKEERPKRWLPLEGREAWEETRNSTSRRGSGCGDLTSSRWPLWALSVWESTRVGPSSLPLPSSALADSLVSPVRLQPTLLVRSNPDLDHDQGRLVADGLSLTLLAASRSFPVYFTNGEVVYPQFAYPLRKEIVRHFAPARS